MTSRSSRASRFRATDAGFERLYWAHHRAVLAYCARRVSRADAWDAASEVFLVAWRRPDDVPPGDEARAWLLGVAYRVLANQRRGSRRKAHLLERAAGARGEPPLWPEELVIRNEEAREVIAALARLRLRDREILQLTAWEGLSPVEIAAVLEISRDAVDQRYSRAKRRLARELDRSALTWRHGTHPAPENGGAHDGKTSDPPARPGSQTSHSPSRPGLGIDRIAADTCGHDGRGGARCGQQPPACGASHPDRDRPAIHRVPKRLRRRNHDVVAGA